LRPNVNQLINLRYNPFCCRHCDSQKFFDFLADESTTRETNFENKNWFYQLIPLVVLDWAKNIPGDFSCVTNPYLDPDYPVIHECEFTPESETTCEELLEDLQSLKD